MVLVEVQVGPCPNSDVHSRTQLAMPLPCILTALVWTAPLHTLPACSLSMHLSYHHAADSARCELSCDAKG